MGSIHPGRLRFFDWQFGLNENYWKQKEGFKRLNYMKTKTFPKIALLISLMFTIFAACTPFQEPSPAATLPPEDTIVSATPTRLIPTREVPDKFDKLTPIVLVEKEPIDMNPISPADLPANLQEVANQAISELAKELSIPSDQILLISAQSVVWSDSSLGCPQPDMFYAQVLTEGYRVVLAVNDEPYYYHANRKGYGIFCKNPNPPYSEGALDR